MGHSHSHGHGDPSLSARLSPLAARIVIGLLVVAAAAVAVGVVVLWPSHRQHDIPIRFQSAAGGAITTVTGKITAQTFSECSNPQSGQPLSAAPTVQPDPNGQCISNTVHISSGPDKGSITLIQVPTNRVRAGLAPDSRAPQLSAEQQKQPQPGQPDLQVGNEIRMVTVPGPAGRSYAFYDFVRGTPTIMWVIAFAVAVILAAAWRGLRSVIGLVFAFGLLLWFALPSLLDGHSPVAVAIVSSAAILFVVIYLAHGLSLRTSAALLGTLVSLAAAAGLSWLAVTTMHLAGFSEQSTSLQAYQNGISIQGILLAGFIIGALGVLNDVTVTQSSAVFELAAADTKRGRLRTFTAAMRVGRDHIASTVYTLVFAYAGAALPLLLLYSVSGQPFSTIVTSDTVAVEIARACVGGIALALSVPLTTAVAVLLTDGAKAPAAADQPDTQRGRHALPGQ